MKTILILLALAPLAATAQISGKSVSEYTTRRGTTFHKGDTIHFGLGTDIGGRFKYSVVPPNFLVGTGAMPFTSNYANTSLVVKDLRVQDKNKKMAPRTVAVVNAAGLNAAVDLDAAEEAGEIRTRNNQATASSPASPADELLKLKKLLDAGAITQAEYDTQKAKLLR